jgi:GNAT superfamily N-acetyltransferase
VIDLRSVRRVETKNDLDRFDCGVPALDEWLSRFALSDRRAGASVTYVLERGSQIVAFYTLAPHTIEHESAPGRLGAGLPRQRPIPVILPARLGLDRSVQVTGLGGDLLKNALARCAAAADDIGGRAVVVHAKDAEAAAFYQRYGLVPLEQNPNHLFVLMKDLRASIRRSVVTVRPRAGPC